MQNNSFSDDISHEDTQIFLNDSSDDYESFELQERERNPIVRDYVLMWFQIVSFGKNFNA